jgi:hypothetical protein
MAGMRRWNQIVVLVATLAIAALPLIHNHPLIPDAARHGPAIGVPTVQCAICATHNVPVPAVPESIETPDVPETDFISLTPALVPREAFPAAGSRAPPLA